MLLHCGFVFGIASHAKQTSVDFGMQRLDASIQTLGRSRVLRHVRHFQARISQSFGGPSRRQQVHFAFLVEKRAKLDDAGFIGD